MDEQASEGDRLRRLLNLAHESEGRMKVQLHEATASAAQLQVCVSIRRSWGPEC
jgi:hypothetical protein